MAKKPYYVIEDFENGRGWNGDAKSVSFNDIEVSKTTDRVRFGKTALKMKYDFLNTAGVSGVYAEPSETINIPGKAKKIGMWVYGDGAGHWLRMQLEDAEGENFNVDLTDDAPKGVNWQGWKYLEAEISDFWTAPFKVKDQGVRYMATDDDTKNAGTIYIDKIIALYDEIEEDVKNPEITQKSPGNRETITENTPKFKIIVEDDESGIDFDRTIMRIDGVEVNSDYLDDKIVYQVKETLADGLHKAYIEVFDQAGNHSFESWEFTINSGNFYLEWNESDKSLAGDTNSVLLKSKNLKNVKGLSFEINHNDFVQNFKFSPSDALKDYYEYKDNKDVFTNLDQLALDKVDLGKFNYDLATDADGQLVLELTKGYYTNVKGEEKSFFVAPYGSAIIQPLVMSIEGISTATESTITVKDLDGNPVDGASISILDHYKLVKLNQEGEILESDKEKISGEFLKNVEKGELFVIAKQPSEGFPYYRIYLKNGTQKYYHLDKELVEEVEWNSLLDGKTKDGVIKTKKLTFSQIPIKIQAQKDQLVSQIFELDVSQQLGKVMPENTLLTWSGSVEDSLHLSWKTNTKNKPTIVQYTDEVLNDEWTEVKGSSTLLGDSTGEMRVHHADLTNLKENTKYYIRMGDGKHWSDLKEYTTPDLNKDEFSFVFVTDSQAYDEDGFQLYADIVEKAKSKNGNLDFILHAGDIVHEGERIDKWDMFLKNQDKTGLPFVFFLGNHDVYGDGTNTYNTLIRNNDNGSENLINETYYLDYGEARFIVLNSEVGVEGMKSQVDWLKETIESNDRAWTIVGFHSAPYKANPKRPDDATAKVFAPVLEEMGVDLVLVGHDHSYMRTYPMSDGEPADEGTIYLIGASAGPKFYPAEIKNYTALSYAEEKQVATNITVSKEEISFEAFNIDGKFVDSFKLEKNFKI